MVGRTEARLCATAAAPPYHASDRARSLHERLWVADLHADSLLWGRDLLKRGNRGQVDVPRLIEGNVALQVLAATTQSPRHLDLERNDDRTDDVVLLAIAQGWPPATWRRLLPRALHLAARADAMAARSDGRLHDPAHDRRPRGVRSAPPAKTVRITAGLLAIEGAHALDRDPANVDVVADAGYRMMSPSHFFDNAFGGSAHGVTKGGLTDKGREMVERMEARCMLVDVAHASPATIDDVLAMARRPVVASHTGLRGACDNTRNLTDAHARAIAETGGVLGIGFWPTACGGDDATAIARVDPVCRRRRRHRARRPRLGLRWRGPGAVRRDRAGRADRRAHRGGFADDDIAKIMGGNVRRLLLDVLPDGPAIHGERLTVGVGSRSDRDQCTPRCDRPHPARQAGTEWATMPSGRP